MIKVLLNIKLGLNSLWAHKLRSGLTTLGIVFGVASVICMLAIGEGLSWEAREQIRRLGSNNIILRSVRPPREMDSTTTQRRQEVLQYGLTYADIERIASTVPKVEVIVPTREIRKDVWFGGKRVDGHVIGTVPWYLEIANGRLLEGRFINAMDMHRTANVCVLSTGMAKSLSGLSSPLNGFVKIGTSFYRVVGVVEGGGLAVGSGTERAMHGLNEVYIPLTASRLRMGEMIVQVDTGSFSSERVELHSAIVRVHDSADVLGTSRVVDAILKRFHEKKDYEMIVPLQLLQEKERVKRLYNIVLGLMAAISLLVGGIGIMNIMLANVSERTPEIGIRRAIGAKKRDIVAQFLTETVLLSGCGGLVGVALGIGMPWLVTRVTQMHTIVTPWAVLIAFGISALVGLVFGLYPALHAANMDPVEALRHE